MSKIDDIKKQNEQLAAGFRKKLKAIRFEEQLQEHGIDLATDKDEHAQQFTEALGRLSERLNADVRAENYNDWYTLMMQFMATYLELNKVTRIFTQKQVLKDVVWTKIKEKLVLPMANKWASVDDLPPFEYKLGFDNQGKYDAAKNEIHIGGEQMNDPELKKAFNSLYSAWEQKVSPNNSLTKTDFDTHNAQKGESFDELMQLITQHGFQQQQGLSPQ